MSTWRMVKKVAKLISLLVAPLLLALVGFAFFLSDLWARGLKITRRRSPSPRSNTPAYTIPRHVSVVMPNWNGKDLLERYLPSVMEDCGPDDEIIVVDNASTDGSTQFLKEQFPQVRVLEMDRNLGFGGGSNAGVRAARQSVVVLLNNDMRVEPGFLRALLAGFTRPEVFAVSAQIFFSDPDRRREETGLTSGAFTKGFFRVRHDEDARIDKPYPIFYAGGGSTAYDRGKFLELGGFDSLFEPFYLEDTDLSYNAWRRGWKVLYQPQARVFHEHRGTIGKHFDAQAIQSALQKNYVLMVWKNLHHPLWMCSHLIHLYGHMVLHSLGRPSETRTTIRSFVMALRRLPQALRSRRDALLRSVLSDPGTFEQMRPCIYRDSLLASASSDGDPSSAMSASPRHGEVPPAQDRRRLNILFVSPYSINPPLHGGAVFMLQALREMARHHNVFVLTFVDSPREVSSNLSLERWAKKVVPFVRKHHPSRSFHLRSNAEQTFHDPEFALLLEKLVYLHDIDLIQYEYTQLAQYCLPLHHIPQCLFEHDIYFRSVGRQIVSGKGGWGEKSQEALEWLRGLRYEVAALERFDAVLTCHEKEQRVLQSLLANGRPWILPGLRTAVEAATYPFPGGPRLKDSLLFIGNFQHRPNADGLQYFCDKVLPLIRAKRPGAMLYVVGAGCTESWEGSFPTEGIRILGEVPDIREPLGQFSVFVCPIRTGAGVRVKILEAFACGIPVISTSLGAEGLAVKSGEEILLADTPEAFATGCLRLLQDTQLAITLAARARRLVETRYNWPVVMERLDDAYQELVRTRRGAPVNQNSCEARAASSQFVAR